MAVIETMTFRLVAGADEAAFLAADKRLQSEFAYQQPGLLRRTTARGLGDRAGEWIVVDLWGSADDAEAAADRWDDDPTARELMSFVDAATVEVRRYADLDD
ncbi:MAG: hypothetical protein ACLFXM_16180 [Acidimicrobiia bacterium]